MISISYKRFTVFSPRVQTKTRFLIYPSCVKFRINFLLIVGEALGGLWPRAEMPVPITCLVQGSSAPHSPGLLKAPGTTRFHSTRGLAEASPHVPMYMVFSFHFWHLDVSLLCKLSDALLNNCYLDPPFIGFWQWKLALFVFNFFSLGSLVTINWKWFQMVCYLAFSL